MATLQVTKNADQLADRVIFRLCCIEFFKLLGLYIMSRENSSLAYWVNAVALVTTVVFSMIAVARLLTIDTRFIVSPITWAIFTYATYYGFGPSLHIFGSQDTIARSSVHYAVTMEDLLRVCILNSLFFSLFLASYLFVTTKLRGQSRSKEKVPLTIQESRALILAVASFLIGWFVRYRFSFPHEFGRMDYVLPGIFYQLELLVPLSLAPMFFLACRRGTIVKIVVLSLMSFEIVVGLLRSAKSSMIFGIVMACTGALLGQKSRWMVGMLFCLGIVTMVFLGDAVMNLRQEVSAHKMVADVVGLADRLEVARNLLAEDRLFGSETKGSASWCRLDYTSIQALLMNRYDRGYPGEPYVNTFWALVPRVMYPDKPVTSHIGLVISKMLMGPRSTTHMAVGLAGEAYWAGGWPFVLLISFIVGAVLALVEYMLSRVPAISLWTFFPCYVLSIRIATRLDGFFTIDWAGAFVIFVATYLFAMLVERTIFETDVFTIGESSTRSIPTTQNNEVSA